MRRSASPRAVADRSAWPPDLSRSPDLPTKSIAADARRAIDELDDQENPSEIAQRLGLQRSTNRRFTAYARQRERYPPRRSSHHELDPSSLRQETTSQRSFKGLHVRHRDTGPDPWSQDQGLVASGQGRRRRSRRLRKGAAGHGPAADRRRQNQGGRQARQAEAAKRRQRPPCRAQPRLGEPVARRV